MRRCCRAGLWAAAARLEKLNKDSLREAVLPFVVVKGSDMRCNDRCGEAVLADYCCSERDDKSKSGKTGRRRFYTDAGWSTEMVMPCAGEDARALLLLCAVGGRIGLSNCSTKGSKKKKKSKSKSKSSSSSRGNQRV